MKSYTKFLAVLALVVMANSFAAADDIGFTGNYAPGAWSFNANGADGSLIWNDPTSFTIVGNNDGQGGVSTTLQTTAAYSGFVTFRWSYDSNDPDNGFDYPFYITVNGSSVLCCSVPFGSEGTGAGTISFYWNAGDVLGFGVYSVDGIFGPGKLTISEFKQTAAVPEPATLFLLGSGLVGAAGTLRKRFAKA